MTGGGLIAGGNGFGIGGGGGAAGGGGAGGGVPGSHCSIFKLMMSKLCLSALICDR